MLRIPIQLFNLHSIVYYNCVVFFVFFFSDFSGRKVSYHRATLPWNQYKLVFHILTIFRISRTIYCMILIYSDYHLFWLFCVLVLLCQLLCTCYVLYIMCFHTCNYIILYLRYVLIDDGTPDSITTLFDLEKLFTQALLSR